MGSVRTALGNRGEERAVRHLQSLGYEIVERNYRCKSGEIDIVARDGGDLVFVEVKSRRSIRAGYPSEAVDSRKQRKMVLAAESYIAERDLGDADCRFDIVEVYFTVGSPVRLEVIKHAFWAVAEETVSEDG